jgi:hypothetical protein
VFPWPTSGRIEVIGALTEACPMMIRSNALPDGRQIACRRRRSIVINRRRLKENESDCDPRMLSDERGTGHCQ